jgi:hypothetical protein
VLDSNLDSHGIIEGCRKAEVEVISLARWLALRGPADHDKFLPVQTFDLAPHAAIAGRMGALCGDALEALFAGTLMKCAPAADLVVAVMQGSIGVRQQTRKTFLACGEGPGAEILAVEIEQIEEEEDQRGGVPVVRSELDDVERGNAVGSDAAQFAITIGLAGAKLRHSPGNRRIFVGPVEAGARQQLDRTMIDPGVHAVAVVFDFMGPVVAFRRSVDGLRELRADPLRQGVRAPARCRLSHAVSINRFQTGAWAVCGGNRSYTAALGSITRLVITGCGRPDLWARTTRLKPSKSSTGC